MKNNAPLVSIIVRTKDRPDLLKRALSSIASQTYRPIEVVIVNDGGCDLDLKEITGILKDVSVNYVRLKNNTGRAHAGNVGIENSKGAYIGFLDDDDEFLPEHVIALINFIKRNDYRIAYSAVDFVEKKYNKDYITISSRIIHKFAQDFSFNALLIGNYIPLISLLFESSLLKKIKFDENFELYEDWDMLIRAAELTPFYFIDKATAIYNQWGDSQIAFKSSPETIKEATLKVYEKHKSKIPAKVIYEMREERDRKNAMLAEKNSYIDILEQKIKDLEMVLKEKENYIQNIQAGRGWGLMTRYQKIKKSFFSLGR